MRSHEQVHRTLADWKQRIERDELIIETGSDADSAGAQATLESFLRPAYHNGLEDHLRTDHSIRNGDPWAYTRELEELHSSLHSD